MPSSPMFVIVAIGLMGFACQWVAWRTQLPAILYLLLTGVLVGPVFNVLNPDALFGDLLFPFISLMVAIILFEGSLTLKKSELKEIGGAVRNMVSYGALINAIVTGTAAHILVGLEWELAFLFGAIVVVTGPTVIQPMLKTVRPNKTISRTLRWESIVIDPLGALFAVLVFEWIVVQQSNASLAMVFWVFFLTVAAGFVIGLMFAYFFGLLLRHHWVPEYLQNYASVAFVSCAYFLADALMHESGLLAVTVMGFWLVNMRGVHMQSILNFKEDLTVMFVSGLFIILAARLDFSTLQQVGWGALGVLFVMQFIARPLKVLICTYGSSFSNAERVLIGWIGPRGIVAAAVSALFALRLEEFNFEHASFLVPLTFSVIIGTVIIQGASARFLAKALNVCEPEAQGYLIIGANPVAIEIAKSLHAENRTVVLCSTYWHEIRQARMANLTTYYGNPMSDHAYINLDLTGIGGLLGLSRDYEHNTAAALRFREDFSTRNVFSLAPPEEYKVHEKHRPSEQYTGRTLFGKKITYEMLNDLIQQRGQIKRTTLTKSYTYRDWVETNIKKQGIPLFAIDPANRIHWFTGDAAPEPLPEWVVFSLSEADKEKTV